MTRALGIQAKHDAMGEGEGGLITGSGEQAPWHPVLAAQPMCGFPAVRQSGELGRAALVMSL